MNITVTTITNPFSFFCIREDQKLSKNDLQRMLEPSDLPCYSLFNVKNEFPNVVHGQYVAVMWKEKWVRGIVCMESQLLIWLVDYGIYIRSQETICVHLPQELKTLASKVFEASIHGVVPVEKVISFDGTMENKITSVWNEGAKIHVQKLINFATKTIFVPVALLSTKTNDVVLGDLYLELPGRGMTNIITELELWPVFLQRNHKAYLEGLRQFYNGRRRHRASTLKPDISNLQIISLQTTLEEYSAICENVRNYECLPPALSDGSTDLNNEKDDSECDDYLSPEEMDDCANTKITVYGRSYNLLQTLMTKYKEIQECKRYQNHDLKSMGRGCKR